MGRRRRRRRRQGRAGVRKGGREEGRAWAREWAREWAKEWVSQASDSPRMPRHDVAIEPRVQTRISPPPLKEKKKERNVSGCATATGTPQSHHSHTTVTPPSHHSHRHTTITATVTPQPSLHHSHTTNSICYKNPMRAWALMRACRKAHVGVAWHREMREKYVRRFGKTPKKGKGGILGAVQSSS